MPRPYHLSLDLEVVTPLFLGGANPQGDPELRPPPFRGALRYWLRAALGGVLGDRNLIALRNLEAAVMGDTTMGSPVSLRIGSPHLTSAAVAILPHDEASTTRRAFETGTFRLTMSQMRDDDDAVWQVACAALGLALTFGGVGLRSRRGYGTLRVKASDWPLVGEFPVTATGWEAHTRTVLGNAVAAAQALAADRKVPCVHGPAPAATSFPAANLLGSVRISRGTAATAMAAVTEFMKLVHAHPDPARGGIAPKQASPLWVRPILMDGTYGLLLTVLASQFGAADYAGVQGFLNANCPAYRQITVKGWNA